MGRKNRRKRQAQQQQVAQRQAQPIGEHRLKSIAKKVTAHLLTFLLGSGIIWQLTQYKFQRENQSDDYRKQIIVAQDKVLNTLREMLEAEEIKDPEQYNKRRLFLKHRLRVEASVFDEWEEKLAAIEERSPREIIPIDFPPGPPHSPGPLKVKPIP